MTFDTANTGVMRSDAMLSAAASTCGACDPRASEHERCRIPSPQEKDATLRVRELREGHGSVALRAEIARSKALATAVDDDPTLPPPRAPLSFRSTPPRRALPRELETGPVPWV